MKFKCTKCLVFKEDELFPPSKRGQWCTRCYTLYYREIRNVKSPRDDLEDGMRKCKNCLEIKPLDEFVKNKNCKFGRERTCKKCLSIARKNNPAGLLNQKRLAKKWYENNKEITICRSSQWQKDNPAKVIAREHRRRQRFIDNGNNDLTSDQINKLKSIIDYCVICDSKENLTIEHIVSSKLGGQNTISNITITCLSCNCSKGAYGRLVPTNTRIVDGVKYVTAAKRI